jgi:hypothetical protein
MVFRGDDPERYSRLRHFKNWANGAASRKVPFDQFRADHKEPAQAGGLLDLMTE